MPFKLNLNAQEKVVNQKIMLKWSVLSYPLQTDEHSRITLAIT